MSVVIFSFFSLIGGRQAHALFRCIIQSVLKSSAIDYTYLESIFMLLCMSNPGLPILSQSIRDNRTNLKS